MLNNFIYAKTKDLFLEKLNAGEVLDEAIVFIEDTKEIWNHGTYFMSASDAGIDEDTFNATIASINSTLSNKLDKNEAESTYAKITDIPDVSNFITENDADAAYADKSAFNTLSESVSTIDTTLGTKADKAELTSYAKSDSLSSYTPISRTINGKALSNNISLVASDVSAASVNDFNTLQGTVNTLSTTVSKKIDTDAANNTFATKSQLNALIGEGAADTLDTIGEISAAIEENQSVLSTLNSAIGNKANQSDLNTTNSNVSGLTTKVGTLEGYFTSGKAKTAESADSATTATNLASAPTLAAGTTNTNKITVTAGGKKSSEFTVPYATSAGSADTAVSASNVAWSGVSGKPSFATVATSGKYSDLSGTPTIPSVGNGTITIKQGGTSKGSFTLNQSGSATIELTDNNTTYSAGTGLSLSGTTFSADGSAIINSLGEGTSAATRNDYIVAQYADGGTTTTTYHRRKLSNIFAALNKSDITTALGYTPPTTNTTYSLVGAQNSTGLIKNGSSVTSTSGLTACPIINGIPYYKDTNTTYTLSSLGIGNVKNYDQSKAIKAITRSGTTFTYTCLDGTTGTFTQQDNNTTYSAATTSADGLMTSAMVTKLNGIASGATAVSSSTVSGWGFTKNAGTITGVTAGNGLTGGGTSGSVTLNIGAGTGITVNADTVEMNSTYRTYCTNGNSAWASYGTATSVASVPVGYKLVKCTISAAGSFTLTSTPAAGREVHVLIYNSSSADVVVSLPTASPYVNFSGDSLTVPATGYAEINVISDGSTMFIRHAA